MSWWEREDGGPSWIVYAVLVASLLGGLGVIAYEAHQPHPPRAKQTKPWLDR